MKLLAMTERGNIAENKLGKLEILDVPVPVPEDDEVLIKIHYSSICGSDPHILKGLLETALPTGMGHEMSGEVAALGPKATKTGLKIGDYVTGNFIKPCGSCYYCRNGMDNLCTVTNEGWNACQAEYVIWKESQVYKVPKDVDMLSASLTEPTAISLRLIERASLKLGAYVLVIGGGGIGQLAAQLARNAGASKVVISDIVKEKREIALQLGADFELDPADPEFYEKAMEITDGLGFDAVLETSGSGKAAEQGWKVVGRGGNMVSPAMHNPAYNLPVNLYEDCYINQKELRGMFMSQTSSFPKTVRMLRRMQLKPLIQRVYPLEDFQKAYDDAISGKYIKVVFDLTK